MQSGNTLTWTAHESRLWEVVKENPKDHSSWLTLISIVESHRDIRKICAVYENFLLSFPLSAKHRKNYAYQLRYHSLYVQSVLLYQDLKLPLFWSVEFWKDYYELAKASHKDYNYLHYVSNTAVTFVGQYYDSGPVWELSSVLEEESKQWEEVYRLYSKMFQNPFKGMSLLFERFKQLPKSVAWDKLLTSDEQRTLFPDFALELPYEDKVKRLFEEALQNEAKVMDFEQHIKSSDSELGQVDDHVASTWHEYIDFVEKEFPNNVESLLKRSLVPCWTRGDLWLRYAEFIEDNHAEDNQWLDYAAQVLDLAVSYTEGEAKLELMLFTAGLKERRKDFAGALSVYYDIGNRFKTVPLEVLEAHANLQHRLGHIDRAVGVFQDSIDADTRNGSGLFSPALRLKFARFALVVLEKPRKAMEILTGLLDLELSTPVVEGVIDIASALPEVERKEFLTSLDQMIMKFVLAEVDDEAPSEMSAKRNTSLLYLEFLDYFGHSHQYDMATKRHFSHFHRGNNILVKRRSEFEIDTDISKKLKIDAATASERKLDVLILSLPSFLSKHADDLIEDKWLDVGALKGSFFTRITHMGRRLIKAICKVLMERHSRMCWCGEFVADDIMISYDGTITSSIICSFRKEPLDVMSWVVGVKNDYWALEKILEPHFKSKKTSKAPPYFKKLFSFGQTAEKSCNSNEGSRQIFLQKIAAHPLFKSPLGRNSLCRQLYMYIRRKHAGKYDSLRIPLVVTASHGQNVKITEIDKLVDAIVKTMMAMGSGSQSGSGFFVTLIRHMEAHAIDHLEKLLMTIGGIEDVYDLVDFHFEEFMESLVVGLFEELHTPRCDRELAEIIRNYEQSD